MTFATSTHTSHTPFVFTVNGWPLAKLSSSDEEAMVQDLVLAEKLKYERPRVIKDLIKRLLKEGKISGVQTRRTTRRVARQGRGEVEMEVEEFWLPEAAALKVILKSETSVADQIADEVIEVFMLARKGLLDTRQQFDTAAIVKAAMEAIGPAIALAVAPILDRMAALEERLSRSQESPMGSIDRSGGNWIRSQLRVYAGMLGDTPEERRSWRQSGEIELRSALGFTGIATTWNELPARLMGDARLKLREMIHRAQKHYNDRERHAQTSIAYGETPIPVRSSQEVGPNGHPSSIDPLQLSSIPLPHISCGG